MFRYAQLDENNVVVGISNLSGIVEEPDMIFLGDDETVNIGWRLIDGQWREPEDDVPPDTFEKAVTLGELKEYLLLNMQLTLEAIEAMEGGADNA